MSADNATAIVCDTTAYLPGELIAEYGIHTVSLYVTLDGVQRAEGEISAAEYGTFYERLSASPGAATTSQPSVGDFVSVYGPLLDEGREVPAVALDDEGYATALADRDESITISPHLMGALHATVAEEGTGGFAAGLVAPGPHTTGYYSEITATRRLAKERDCMNYDSIFAATTYPVYALRREDGGALIFYSLNRTTTWHPVLKCGEGRRLEIPEGARWLLTDPTILAERRIVETQHYVSVVPAKNAAGSITAMATPALPSRNRR